MKHFIGQHLIIGLSGETLTADEKSFIIDNNIGGVVLFARNCKSPEQVFNLCSEIQNLRHELPYKTPFFISIDMEGGRVHRFKDPFTQWPPLKKLGDLDAPTVSFEFAQRMGDELSAVGVNLDFAPCLDVFTNPKNTVIGDRAISTEPNIVAKHASALIRGYLKSNIISCAKHFPGHGHTLIDSHVDLPVCDLTLDHLRINELVPFNKALRSKIPMVMIAHILFSKIDDKNPATFSKTIVTDLLKSEMRFEGIVVSDDLDMGALSKYHSTQDIPVKALQAGIDLLLYCNKPDSPKIAMKAILGALEKCELTELQIQKSYEKILEFKIENIILSDEKKFSDIQHRIGSDENKLLAQSIRENKLPNGLNL